MTMWVVDLVKVTTYSKCVDCHAGVLYVIAVTWAWGLCLICMSNSQRASGPRAEGIYIRQSPNTYKANNSLRQLVLNHPNQRKCIYWTLYIHAWKFWLWFSSCYVLAMFSCNNHRDFIQNFSYMSLML